MIEKVVDKYKNMVDNILQIYLDDEKFANPVGKICKYALMAGGGRFRPILTLIVAEAIGKKFNVNYAALAVEFFHTASLIADDMPCMDNSDLRRGKQTTHKVFGESKALLAIFSLIAEGYDLVNNNGREFRDNCADKNAEESYQRLMVAIENCSQTSGINGIQCGQYFDLFPEEISESGYLQVIEKKTVPLFENAFVLGWIFGGGDLEKLEIVKNASKCFGIIFQLVDDFSDVEEDEKNGRLNGVSIYGKNEARNKMAMTKEAFDNYINLLKIDGTVLMSITGLVVSRSTAKL